MQTTDTLIIGASISGLACASCLQHNGIDYLLIEKEGLVATPWRRHYERLHLHTPKVLSNLPYKKFGKEIPRYPSRQQVLDYLEDYRAEFDINPFFHTEAKQVRREGDYWITYTTHGTFRSRNVIVATGAYGKPKPVQFKGLDTFPGTVLHSYSYKHGAIFKNKRVLVVGFGNSACEIAIDLFEEGALPSMAVRSGVNVIPRDFFGIPILHISQIMSKLPPKMADALNNPLMNLLFGDIRKLGLKKMPYGVFEQIKKDEHIPLLDIGTISHIRKKHITIHPGLDHIEGRTVYFEDGSNGEYDAIIAAIGYYRDYANWLEVPKERFEDLKEPISHQKYFGQDGLYFCGFHVSPTGAIHEIASDAKQIAAAISRKQQVHPETVWPEIKTANAD